MAENRREHDAARTSLHEFASVRAERNPEAGRFSVLKDGGYLGHVLQRIVFGLSLFKFCRKCTFLKTKRECKNHWNTLDQCRNVKRTASPANWDFLATQGYKTTHESPPYKLLFSVKVYNLSMHYKNRFSIFGMMLWNVPTWRTKKRPQYRRKKSNQFYAWIWGHENNLQVWSHP